MSIDSLPGRVKLRSLVGTLFLVLLLLAVGAMLVGQAVGQPILLGYVETGSMAPTMEPGDGFVAIPSEIAGPPEEGDVITFRAEEIQGGGLTTHRVVGETEAGYITRGDANPFTDQSGGEPPVTDEQIVATALEMNGQVVVISNLGTVITALQFIVGGLVGAITGAFGLDALLGGGGSAQSLVWVGVAIIAVGFIADAVTGDRSAGRRTDRRSGYIKSTTFILVLVLIVVTPATASMVIPSGTTSFDIVSSESPNENPLVIGVGEESSIEYQVANDGFIPVLAVIEPRSEGLSVSRSSFIVSGRSQKATTLRIDAPETTGAYAQQISQWRYIPILPRSILLSLHAIHPFVAVAVIDLVLVVGAVIAGLIAVGTGPVRMRSTGRDITTLQRLKRRLF